MRMTMNLGALGLRVQRELRDRHRQCRTQIVQVHHLQQRLRDFREFVVELEVDACEKRERFNQSFDVQILGAASRSNRLAIFG